MARANLQIFPRQNETGVSTMPWNASILVPARHEEWFEKERERWIARDAEGKERVYVRNHKGQVVPRQEVI